MWYLNIVLIHTRVFYVRLLCNITVCIIHTHTKDNIPWETRAHTHTHTWIGSRGPRYPALVRFIGARWPVRALYEEHHWIPHLWIAPIYPSFHFTASLYSWGHLPFYKSLACSNLQNKHLYILDCISAGEHIILTIKWQITNPHPTTLFNRI